MPAPAPLAAWLDSYRADLRSALDRARHDRFTLVSANAAGGLLDPTDLSDSARRHLARHVRGLGLSLDALGAEFPGAGLAEPRTADQRLHRFRTTLELCRVLGVERASVNLSGLGDPAGGGLAAEMLGQVADLADRLAVRVAVRAAPGELAAAAASVRRLNCPRLGLGLDSAAGDATAGDARALSGLIGAVHLRDVRRVGDGLEEVAFGRGDVDFVALLARLAECDYAGSFLIRRDAASAPVDALRQGREYVASLLAAR